MALLGSVTTMSVCSGIVMWKGSALQFLGKNSLIIMCVHEPIKRIVIQIGAIITGESTDMLRGDILWSLAFVAAVVVICLPIIYLVNNKMPFMIGREKKK